MNAAQLNPNFHKHLLCAYQRGMTPPLRIPLDDWADKFRFMSDSTGEKWYTERVEIARGPMRSVTEPGVHTITVMCCTQVLKTELILNIIGYFAHLDPCPILVVQPKEEVAKKFSHVRLKQMIKSSPVLRNLFVEQKQRDSTDTALHKEFPGGHVTIVSAKTPSNLAMLPIRIVLLDEIDKYDESAGAGDKKEGDPINLAEERMSKYASNCLSVRACSPTTKGISRIYKSYLTSDQRKPHVACPHCGHWQIMLWQQVKWDKDANGDPVLDSTQYHCAKCDAGWTEYQRLQAIGPHKIRWLQTAEFACGECGVVNRPAVWDVNNAEQWNKYGHAVCEGCHNTHGPNHHAGFWANKLYSPFRPLSDMVKLWDEAQGNIEHLRTFINTQLAEVFEEAGEQIKDVAWLMKRRERYDGELPSGAGIITAGVDTQNNRIECEVVAWGMDEESWSIDYIVLPGDLSQPQVWKELEDVLTQPYYRFDGHLSYIAAAAIDMGGGFTQQVANFCRTRIAQRYWPIRGVGGDGRPYPVWPKNPGRTTNTNVPYYNVGTDAAKNIVYSRLLIDKPGAGHCHFPLEREGEWFEQLTAERRVIKHRGTTKYLKWENPGNARNEGFDMRCYAYAALCGLQSLGWKVNLITEERRLILPPEFEEKRQAKREQITTHTAIAQPRKKTRVVKSKFME